MSFQIGGGDKDKDQLSTASSGSIGIAVTSDDTPHNASSSSSNNNAPTHSNTNTHSNSKNAYSSATRPNTASSTFSDPFASPDSSRPPSIRPALSPSGSTFSFPFGLSNAPNHVPRSILHQSSSKDIRDRDSHLSSSGLGGPPTYGYSSARSSSQRIPHFTSANSLYGVLPTPSTPNPDGSTAALRHKGTRMKSHKLPDDVVVPKPWKEEEKKSARKVVSYWIVYALALLGFAGGAVQCFFTVKNVQLDKEPLCIVLDEDFSNPDTVFGEGGTFFREVTMDGFGNGQFEMTTASSNNSFVQDGKLYIVPTLTADNIGMDAVLDGTIYNITGCTFNETRPDGGFILQPDGSQVFDIEGYTNACSKVSNATSGAIINPVQSARLTTIKSASIRYGRVEIRAKMPHGDWLWPAIWMLPKDSVYGPWPMSGEIDIVESRGNGLRYTAHGSNYVQGSLNWGPAPGLNGVDKTYSWWSDKRKSFADEFHTYALEWTPKFLRIYVDSRLHTLLDLRFNKPFFERAEWPATVFDGNSLAPLHNPWANGTNATPFDQEFFLILNVAVGGTNGWFPEAQGDKPWLNSAGNPQRDFLSAIEQWYPTWGTDVNQRAMVVDYVKMWKHCKAPA
ncbi:glucan 1,3-beta-glucosidase [Coprinopsis cinerea okayama7|uniref:Glucan 1,3-beta-glucosidase n=1 Tax=Coprinopsis cinerea (strain Okayama-7 / 130 / ATCC MYA-4618 / FGSC 9003) TaxID=240176 RepID=A8PGE1_COPC7|nr:glucan 1,3-beta-glucosidase [Coprinopsis cinerea okayama7\|eukprot:XP_001841195.1 glucan 1,3-beta-glucosidase [Coprinopsis cinerea okayama7\